MTESIDIQKSEPNPLKSKRLLKKFAVELSDAYILTTIGHLNSILEDRKLVALEAEQNKAERQEKMAKIAEMMKSLNLSIEDIEQLSGASSTKRSIVKPKYEIKDASGEVQTWSGRGRTPKAFLQAKQDSALEQYLIEA